MSVIQIIENICIEISDITYWNWRHHDLFQISDITYSNWWHHVFKLMTSRILIRDITYSH